MYISKPTYALVLFRGTILPSPKNVKLYSKPRHREVCLTTDPQSLSKQVHYRLRSSASSYNFQYSFRLTNSCLRLMHRLPVTYIILSIYPSIAYCIRQFLRRMWTIQSAYLSFIAYRIFFSPLTPRNTSQFLHNRSNWYSASFSSSNIFQNIPGIGIIPCQFNPANFPKSHLLIQT
jgi:hypothetical protein